MLYTNFNYPGSRDKIVDYLLSFGVPYSVIIDPEIIINVEPGGWSLDCFGYAEHITYHDARTDVWKVSAFAPKWAWFIRDWVNSKIVLHELGHVAGIEKCESFWDAFCLMFEAGRNEEGDEKWWEELMVAPFQLLTGFRLCKRCKEVMRDKGVLKINKDIEDKDDIDKDSETIPRDRAHGV